MTPAGDRIVIPPDANAGGNLRCGTMTNADDPTDVVVLLEIGPYRGVLTPEGARALGDALVIEAALATVLRAQARGDTIPPTPPATDPLSPPWEACKVCGGDHWTRDHPARSGVDVQ